MNDHLSFAIELLMYSLVSAYAAVTFIEAVPLGLSLFSASAILVAFCTAMWSLFRMLTRGHK